MVLRAAGLVKKLHVRDPDGLGGRLRANFLANSHFAQARIFAPLNRLMFAAHAHNELLAALICL